VRANTDPNRQAQALAAVSDTLSRAGQHELAVDVARAITDPDRQAPTLTAKGNTRRAR